MKANHLSHPPWARQHKPATPRPAAPTWRGLRLQLTPSGKRFKVGERISGLVTLPSALNAPQYHLVIDYVQRLVGPDGEAEQVLSTVTLAGSQLTGGPTFRFIFDRPISGLAYRSDAVRLDYYVRLRVFSAGGEALPLVSRQTTVPTIRSGIAYAVEPMVLSLATANSGIALAGAVAAVFIVAGLALFSSRFALGFGLLVGLPFVLRGVHYGLKQWAFRRATLTVGPTWTLHDLRFDTDGRDALIDGTLTLTVREQYRLTDKEGNTRTKRKQLFSASTYLLDTIIGQPRSNTRSLRIPLLAPDTVLPVTTTANRTACSWALTYTHRLPFWPLPLRRHWPLRVSMKRK